MPQQKLFEARTARDAPCGNARHERNAKPKRNSEHDCRCGIVTSASHAANQHEYTEAAHRCNKRPQQQRGQIAAAGHQKRRSHADESGVRGGIPNECPLPQHAEAANHSGCKANGSHAGGHHERVVGNCWQGDHGVRPRCSTARPNSSNTSRWPA